MNKMIAMAFGGLNRLYYMRHLVFGIILGLVYAAGKWRTDSLDLVEFLVAIISTLLYPYSRFVYESVVGFFLGRNVLVTSGLIMMLLKVWIMIACWFLAIFIAPVGLAYLYWHHSRARAS
ncbi:MULTISPECIES: hypothetical protein [Pseudomonas]|jgi:hypothetical protein|uniref:Uncharacterized protein n=2 Tax=Pseudomonas TaxID=286 RepID=A0AAJ5S7B2_9PSED|nr:MULTISPECIES: hypothetical protein [Pseudomonas]MCT8164081.1 hypothetical protein [Pseudomonas sp. HD6422]MCT8182931.1 hypothetical protein [Pseudomonas sp. HD6421]MDH1930402.1 hypothetical protein [Pseudomonas sp. GD03696]MDM1711801.1 hypothetical protein [Pseudomonas sp. 165]ORL53100.1 hypothetical protein B7H18_03720 [Pseudomonas putida]